MYCTGLVCFTLSLVIESDEKEIDNIAKGRGHGVLVGRGAQRNEREAWACACNFM